MRKERRALRASVVNTLFFLSGNLRFNVHVAKFARLEDFATVKTFDEFRVFVTGDHLDTRMAAGLIHGFALQEVGVRA
jgi:hypothetical protein